MILYHGSNVAIDKINLSLGNPDKDFGKGFYLTDIKGQAQQMGVRKVRTIGKGEPTLTCFEFDEKLLRDKSLKVKVFRKPSREWAKFIMNNRSASETGFTHDYDIVVGPIANDGVAFQLQRYARKLISLDTLVKELSYRKLNRQYFFGTEKAISKLVKK